MVVNIGVGTLFLTMVAPVTGFEWALLDPKPMALLGKLGGLSGKAVFRARGGR